MRKIADLHNDIEKKFPGLIGGVSLENNGNIYVNQWYTKNENDINAIKNLIKNYNWNLPSDDLSQKLIDYANELDTDSFTQAKQKLEHAQLTTDETKRAALIQEADTIYKGKK